MMKKICALLLALLCVPVLLFPVSAAEDAGETSKTLGDLLESSGMDWDLPQEILDIDLSGVDLSFLEDKEAREDLLEKFRSWQDSSADRSDEEIREEIRRKAEEIGIRLTDGQLDQLLELFRKADSFRAEDWLSHLEILRDEAEKLREAAGKVSDFKTPQFVEEAEPFLKIIGRGIRSAWRNVRQWVAGLF